MNKTHNPKDNVHRLHIKRKVGSRGLISIKQCIEDAIAGLHHYVQNSQERLISNTWTSSKKQKVTEPPKITKQRQQSKRNKDWKNKRRHGQVIRDSDDIADIK